MNARTILAFSAVVGLLAAGDAAAQKLSLRIDKGLVTLDAENVTVDEVLARWIKTTGLNVVSKNGLGSDVPVSLHLEGVTEREALTTVLRDLSGYIMGERRDPVTGIVTIDRLVILPQSAAQAPASVPRATRVAPALPPPPVFEFETPVELAPAAGVETDAGDAPRLEPTAPNPAAVAANPEPRPAPALVVDFVVDPPLIAPPTPDGPQAPRVRPANTGTSVPANAFGVRDGFAAGTIAPADTVIINVSPSELINSGQAPK